MNTWTIKVVYVVAALAGAERRRLAEKWLIGRLNWLVSGAAARGMGRSGVVANPPAYVRDIYT